MANRHENNNANNDRRGGEPIEHDPLAPPHREEHPELHEHSDISIKALFIFFVAFVGVAVLVHIGLWVLFEIYEEREQQADVARQQSALVSGAQIPPDEVPKLQGVPSPGYIAETPAQDMLKMRYDEHLKLNPLYPTPTENGRARIAIDRAMDLALEQDIFGVAQSQGGADHQHGAHGHGSGAQQQ